MLAVLDTNVLVAALLAKGTPHQLYEAFLAGQFTLVFSAETLAELLDVLTRPSLRLLSTPQEVERLLTLVQRDSLLVQPVARIDACRDPKDNILLECARAGRADYLVTGDKDLLALHPFHGLPILRPADFLRLLP